MFDWQSIKGAGLEEAVRQMPTAVIIVEVASEEVILANDRARLLIEQNLGREMPRELAGFDRFGMFHLDGRAVDIEDLPLTRALYSGEEATGEEYLYSLADGSRRWLRCDSSPIRDDAGSIVAATLVAHDITEQERANEQQQRLAGIVQNSSDFIGICDLDWRVTYINDAGRELVGLGGMEEAKLTRVPDYFALEDMAYVAEEMFAAVMGQGRWTGELNLRHFHTGEQVPVLWDVFRIDDPTTGDPFSITTIARDITERKQAEKAQQDSKRRKEDILESISDGFYALDSEWRLTYINERALSYLRDIKGEELTREELLGRNIWDTFHEAVGTTGYHEYHRALREQKTVSYEERYPPDGAYYEVRAYPCHEGLSVYFRDITERRRKEEQLARHASLLENMHDAVIATDERFLIMTWNRGAEEMYGYSADEAVGRNVWEIVPIQISEERHAAVLREVVETDRLRTEFIAHRKDGEPINTDVTITALYGDDGEISGYLSIDRDITERKRYEAEQQRLVDIVESSSDFIGIADLDMRVTFVNAAGQRMVGLGGPEEVERTKVLDYFVEEDRGFMRDVIYSATMEHGRWSGDRECRFRGFVSGEPIPVLLDVFRLDDPATGEPTGIATVTRDITDRKRYEESLRESEERLRFALEARGLGSWNLDLTTYELHTSQTCKANFGLPPDAEFTYETLFARIHPEDRERVRAAIATAISTGEDYEEDYRILRPEGEERWLSARGRAAYADGGTPLRMGGFTLDITERKRAQIETASRATQQSVVAELGLKALSNGGLQPLMDEAVALTASTLEVEQCEVVELLPGDPGAGKWVLLRSAAGFEEGTTGSTAELDPQSAYTLRQREPVVVEDLRAETRFEPAPLLSQHGVISSVTVMIPGRDGPFGTLGAHTASLQAFSEDEVNFLQSVANVIAIAVEREETETRLEEVREAERGRMARDLHDEALQALTNAIAEAQQLRSTSTDPDWAHKQERIVEALSSVGQHLRGAIYDLRLEQDQDRPFEERLESLVEQHRAMAPEIEISLAVEEGPTFGAPGESATNLLRIVGEALTNARRHSGCTGILLSARFDGGVFRAKVSDDGTGFDLRGGAQPDERAAPSAAGGATGGIGIEAMRERARNVGAELRVESERGEGTTVSVELATRRDARGSTRGQQADRVRVLLVEDHASVREAIASSFEQEPGFEVSGQAASLAEAREMLEASGDARPVDVAVVDLGLPDGYGGDLVKEIRETYPQAQALVLSANLDRAEMARAVEAGAAGVLHKTAHLTEVVDYVRRLRAGQTLIALEEVVELLRFAGRRREEEYEARRAIEHLSPREIEVLRALAEGLDSEGIASLLHISVRTERNHMANILAKLGVHSQLQALVFALRHGVVEAP